MRISPPWRACCGPHHEPYRCVRLRRPEPAADRRAHHGLPLRLPHLSAHHGLRLWLASEVSGRVNRRGRGASKTLATRGRRRPLGRARFLLRLRSDGLDDGRRSGRRHRRICGILARARACALERASPGSGLLLAVPRSGCTCRELAVSAAQRGDHHPLGDLGKPQSNGRQRSATSADGATCRRAPWSGTPA
jgi:hypothetical protein